MHIPATNHRNMNNRVKMTLSNENESEEMISVN